MTTDKARKRATRALAARTGLSYTSAHRLLTPDADHQDGAPAAHRPFVVAVTSPKGGTGKTTLAVNLAVHAARRHLGTTGTRRTGVLPRVLLIDASLQQGDVRTHLGLTSGPSIRDVFTHPTDDRPGPVTVETLTAGVARVPGLDLGAVLTPPTPSDAFPVWYTGRRYTEVVNAAAPYVDLVVVDCPTGEYYHDLFREFIHTRPDRTLVLVDAQRGAAANAAGYLDALTRTPAGADRCAIVHNNAPDPDQRATPELDGWPTVGTVRRSTAIGDAETDGTIAAAGDDPTLTGDLDTLWANLLT